ERIFGISNEKILEDTRKFSKLSPEEYKKATSAYFSHPDDAEAIGKAFSEVLKGKPIGYEARMRRFDGSYIWCKIDLGIILDSEGKPMRLVGYIVDISETKKENEMLKKQVKIDPLTGLYNKTATMILANSILEKEPEGRHSLIVLDIDNFKGVNDTLGHSFGDAVLVDVSAKLKAVFRSDDVVGRIGGDEFAILMKNVPDTNRVLKKAAEISGIFRQTYAGEKENYKISCSMGIVMVENKDERFKTLFLKADAALYQAKQNGKDMFVLYDSDKINNYMTLNAKPNDDVEFMKTHNSLQEQIFTLLYDAKDFESSINMALVTIGQKYNVSRTYVFENDEKNEYTSNTYEWCNTGIKPQIDILKKLAIGESGDSFLDCFDKDGLLYCSDINQVSPYVKKVLEEQDIVSTLMLAIKNNGKIVGFIGFDECTRKRIWSAEEIEVLSTLARILGVFLLKKKAESSRVENLSNRIKILDILPVYICVVNPENHSLEYVNKKMSSVLPSVKSGTFCYTTLRGGQHGPCQTCLVERIKRGDTDNLEIVNEDKSVRVKVNAQYIEWSEHKKMVLLYGNDEVEYRS
ncbi:MAG: diguanylate cyclase, partial [Oscillospiraceae bacterium]